MNPYRVIWDEPVENEIHLAAFLAHERGRDPEPLRRAAVEIGWRLEYDPAEQDESGSGGVRVIVVNPLAAFYAVFEDDRLVVISEVHIREPG